MTSRGGRTVVVTGTGVLSAYGRGTEALLSGVLSGRPAFTPVTRFDVTARRARVAATLPDASDLFIEVNRTVLEACDDACLSASDRESTPVFLALHGDPAIARAP
jgi:3-oxoacyl-[acyl-carrier-protein] synthase II